MVHCCVPSLCVWMMKSIACLWLCTTSSSTPFLSTRSSCQNFVPSTSHFRMEKHLHFPRYLFNMLILQPGNGNHWRKKHLQRTWLSGSRNSQVHHKSSICPLTALVHLFKAMADRCNRSLCPAHF